MNNMVNAPYRLDAEVVKSQIRLTEAQQKAWLEVDKKLYLDEALSRKREERRVRKSAEYDEVIIDDDGTVELFTRNSLYPSERKVCNFTNPTIVRVFSSRGDTGLIVFQFKINQVEKKVVLCEEKMKSRGYVLKLIQLAGGSIYTAKQSIAEKITMELISKLMITASEMVIPYQIGWNRYPDGKIIFAEKGEETWKQIMMDSKKGGYR